LAKSAAQIPENCCEGDPASFVVTRELSPSPVVTVSLRQETANEIEVIDDLPERIPILKEEINAIEAHLGNMLDELLGKANMSQKDRVNDE
jgi:hypothetical protein